MIIDMHTHAGRPNRAGPVDRAVLATMAPGGVCRRRGVGDRRPADDPPQPGRPSGWRRCATRSRASAWPASRSTWGASRPPACASLASRRRSARCRPGVTWRTRRWCWRWRAATSWRATSTGWTRWRRAACARIQLTHYLVNETGDIQTAPPVHGGLTPFGAEAVRRMNRLRHHRRRGALLGGHRGRRRRRPPRSRSCAPMPT